MSHQPRFKGKVWVTFSDNKPEQYTIKEAVFNALTRIYMYAFEGTDFRCGEMNLRKRKTDKKLTMGECIHDEDYIDSGLLSEGISVEKGMQSEGIHTFSAGLGTLFFRPDKTFIKWLVEYANGRIICDIGCGTATLINDLADAGGMVFGIEPNWSAEDNQAMMVRRMNAGKNIINILPRKVQESKTFVANMGDKALLLFARPCHSNFVEDALSYKTDETEALYITVPENLTKYDDLGVFKSRAVKIQHKGWSADNEIVMSIR
jgi:hypothetical protein